MAELSTSFVADVGAVRPQVLADDAHAAAPSVRAGATVTGAATLASGGLNLLFNLVLARLSGRTQYGGVAALLACTTVASFLALGTQYAVARRIVTARDGVTDHLRTGFLSLAPWLLVTVAFVSSAPLIASYLEIAGALPVALAALLCFAVIAAAVPCGALIGASRLNAYAVTLCVTAVLRLVFGTVLAWTIGPFTGALLGSVIGVAAGAGFATALCRRDGNPRHRHDGDRWAESAVRLGRDGMSGALLSGTVWATWCLPLLFGRHFLQASQSGDLAVLQLMVSGLIYAAGGLVPVFYVRLARRAEDSLQLAGVAATLMVVVVGTGVIELAAPRLTTVLYGTSFAGIGGLTLALGCSAAASAGLTYMVWTLRAVGTQVLPLVGLVLGGLATEGVFGTLWHASASTLAIEPSIAMGAPLVILVMPRVRAVLRRSSAHVIS